MLLLVGCRRTCVLHAVIQPEIRTACAHCRKPCDVCTSWHRTPYLGQQSRAGDACDFRISSFNAATSCGLLSLSVDLSLSGAKSGASAFVFAAPTPQRARPHQRPNEGEGGSVAWSPVLDGSERVQAFSGSERQKGMECEQDRAWAQECERGRVWEHQDWARSEKEREKERDRERTRGRDESLTSAYTILASGIPGVSWGGGDMNSYGLGGGAGGSVLGWAGLGRGGGGGGGGYMPCRTPNDMSIGVSNAYSVPALASSVLSAQSPNRHTFSKALFTVTI
jgi:hypothetical protein